MMWQCMMWKCMICDTSRHFSQRKRKKDGGSHPWFNVWACPSNIRSIIRLCVSVRQTFDILSESVCLSVEHSLMQPTPCVCPSEIRLRFLQGVSIRQTTQEARGPDDRRRTKKLLLPCCCRCRCVGYLSTMVRSSIRTACLYPIVTWRELLGRGVG